METNATNRVINFHYLVPRFTFSRRSTLKSFLARIFVLENVALDSLTCVFCSDNFLLEMNRLHLSHDYYTDIITFNLADGAPVAGELYISIDRVRENAKELHLPLQTELLRVIFHGVLHLCGYKDSNATQREEMRAAEDKYLNLYALV